jgi:MbtH protein
MVRHRLSLEHDPNHGVSTQVMRSTNGAHSIGEKMNRDENEDTRIYKAVVNHEEQYSIWPVDRENALGWNDAGKSGTKAECLAYIKEVWTDMRPLSLRRQMEGSVN